MVSGLCSKATIYTTASTTQLYDIPTARMIQIEVAPKVAITPIIQGDSRMKWKETTRKDLEVDESRADTH